MRSSSRRFFNQQSEINKLSIVLRREATMKKHFAVFIFVFLLLGLCVPPGFSQAAGTVKGVCRDSEGKPIADAVVVWANQENGQKYTLKTNKELLHFGKVGVSLDEKELDFDLKKEAEEQAKGTGLTAEQVKQQQEVQEKAKKENNTIKALNEKITTANAAMKNGDFDSAISTLTEATQIDATRDILWAQLADAYRGSAAKQTDSAEKKKRLEEATTDYGKAIDIKQKAVDAGAKKPEDTKQLAAYYNNLGEAAGKSGKI